MFHYLHRTITLPQWTFSQRVRLVNLQIFCLKAGWNQQALHWIWPKIVCKYQWLQIYQFHFRKLNSRLMFSAVFTILSIAKLLGLFGWLNEFELLSSKNRFLSFITHRILISIYMCCYGINYKSLPNFIMKP